MNSTTGAEATAVSIAPRVSVERRRPRAGMHWRKFAFEERGDKQLFFVEHVLIGWVRRTVLPVNSFEHLVVVKEGDVRRERRRLCLG